MNPRRILLDIALRRATRGHGSSKELLRERTAVQYIPDIEAILGSVPWVLVGGLATRAYMQERYTHDVDILIHAHDEHKVQKAFEQAGYIHLGLCGGGFVVKKAAEPLIDLIASCEPWVEHALQNPSYDAAQFPVIPLAYLVVMKLEVVHLQDLADISRMLEATSFEERAVIRQAVLTFCAEYLEDFEQLLLIAEFGTS